MATNKKTGAGASGGNAAVGLAMPEGFTTAASKFYAPSVAHRFDSLPPKGGVVRILLVTNKGTTDEQVRMLLSNPRLAARMKAPGIWEATVMPKDMEATVAPEVGADKMFRWVDLAHRFFGAKVNGPEETATIAVAYDGPIADAKKKLKQLGMTITETAPPTDLVEEDEGGWEDPDEGLVVGTIAGAKLYDLVLTPKVMAIEVRARG